MAKERCTKDLTDRVIHPCLILTPLLRESSPVGLRQPIRQIGASTKTTNPKRPSLAQALRFCLVCHRVRGGSTYTANTNWPSGWWRFLPSPVACPKNPTTQALRTSEDVTVLVPYAFPPAIRMRVCSNSPLQGADHQLRLSGQYQYRYRDANRSDFLASASSMRPFGSGLLFHPAVECANTARICS